jgi:hypothetical protein
MATDKDRAMKSQQEIDELLKKLNEPVRLISESLKGMPPAGLVRVIAACRVVTNAFEDNPVICTSTELVKVLAERALDDTIRREERNLMQVG